jgi:molybdopterin-guanine dinucleotide biosynthesis protein
VVAPYSEPSPKTVFVAGARRNAGKTSVCELLLRSLPGAGAIKLTCCRPDQGCPRDHPCGVCGALLRPFAVIEDQLVLSQRGKDTARLLAAATGKAVWLQSREEAMPEAMAAALARFATAPVVVVEGNAAFHAARPDLGVLVVGSGGAPPKPSVRVALPAVGVVVRNLRPGLAPPAAVEGLGEDIPTFEFDAAHPEADPRADAFVDWVAHSVGFERPVTGEQRRR